MCVEWGVVDGGFPVRARVAAVAYASGVVIPIFTLSQDGDMIPKPPVLKTGIT